MCEHNDYPGIRFLLHAEFFMLLAHRTLSSFNTFPSNYPRKSKGRKRMRKLQENYITSCFTDRKHITSNKYDQFITIKWSNKQKHDTSSNTLKLTIISNIFCLKSTHISSTYIQKIRSNRTIIYCANRPKKCQFF